LQNRHLNYIREGLIQFDMFNADGPRMTLFILPKSGLNNS